MSKAEEGRTVQLRSAAGVRLTPTQVSGIAHAEVLDAEARNNLTWDRYVRLHAVAERVKQCAVGMTLFKGKEQEMKVLDVGGYEGALALFLPEFRVEVIDPATTGRSGADIPMADESCPIVVSIDALEHVPPQDRGALLAELARVTGDLCLINFPNHQTTPAQELALKLTGNQLVREHVEFGLPRFDQVVAEMERKGFSCEVVHHSDSAVWVSQFVLQHVAPESAAETSKHLIRSHRPHWTIPEPLAPLYDLVICRRQRS